MKDSGQVGQLFGESGWLAVTGAGTKYERNQTIRIYEKTII